MCRACVPEQHSTQLQPKRQRRIQEHRWTATQARPSPAEVDLVLVQEDSDRPPVFDTAPPLVKSGLPVGPAFDEVSELLDPVAQLLRLSRIRLERSCLVDVPDSPPQARCGQD